MANEEKVVKGTPTTIANGNGASTSNGAISSAAGTYDNSSGAYPHALFTLTTAGFGGAPTDMSALEIVVRALDIDGTSDAPVPTATYRHKIVGRFIVKADASSGLVYEAQCFNIPLKGEVYIYNDTGQTLSANWTLKQTPFTFAPT